MRGAAWALGLTMIGAGGVAAECANYISRGGAGGPGESGTLLGTETRSGSLGVSGGGKVLKGSAGITRTYMVGFYQMNNGDIIAVDCRTYSQTV